MDEETVAFATEEEFSRAAEDYFAHCDAREDLYGEAGLCLWLSSHNPGGAIVTQQALRAWYDGTACPHLRDAVRLAYLRIQHQIETDPRYQGKGGMTSKALLLLMLACIWVAVDFAGRCWVYREAQESGLIVSQAAELIRAMTPPGERVECTMAPPDMWSRQKDSGKTMAELFARHGVDLVRAGNHRLHGWMAVKEALGPMRGPGDRPGLLVSRECRGLIENLKSIQHDPKRPGDCATEPHEITHICDALRYFCATRTLAAQQTREKSWLETVGGTDYDQVMTGEELDESYLRYG